MIKITHINLDIKQAMHLIRAYVELLNFCMKIDLRFVKINKINI